ncbi:MAG: DNA repair protein RadC [Clostridiales bacterium]|nr:DNA repair protein RadC [Clostridiales bacterium]
MNPHPHAGHRERLKRRMLDQGVASLEPHVVLELLLSYSIPRRDTNELAHRLLAQFGSLRNVFDAPLQDLTAVSGIGAHSAFLIKMIPGLSRVYIESSADIPSTILTTEEARQYVLPRFIDTRQEKLLVVFLGNKNQVLAAEFLQEGSLATVAINTRQIVDRIVQHRATGILLAHNHPDGFAIPSPDDISATRKLKLVLDTMQVKLLDHIVVADNDCISMRDSQLL